MNEHYDSWSKLPFPDGWDRAWDNQNKCIYFVDHNTKQTKWCDPRIEIYENILKDKQQKEPSLCSSSSSSDENYSIPLYSTNASQSSSRISFSNPNTPDNSSATIPMKSIMKNTKSPAKMFSPKKIFPDEHSSVHSNSISSVTRSFSSDLNTRNSSCISSNKSSRNASPAPASSTPSSSPSPYHSIKIKTNAKEYKSGFAKGPMKDNFSGHDSKLNVFFKITPVTRPDASNSTSPRSTSTPPTSRATSETDDNHQYHSKQGSSAKSILKNKTTNKIFTTTKKEYTTVKGPDKAMCRGSNGVKKISHKSSSNLLITAI